MIQTIDINLGANPVGVTPTERPILFNGAMVHALLAGKKTQTRRIVKIQPPAGVRVGYVPSETVSPYGRPGDRLWVRETFAKIPGQTLPWIETDYKATYQHGDRLGDTLGIKKRWTPSIHMPRAASRIDLKVTDVRVERLQDISEADALAEGIVPRLDGFGLPDGSHFHATDPRQSYFSLWEAINGPGSVEANPWVWAVSFERICR